MNKDKTATISWMKRTIIHSRLPLAVYFNFSIGNCDDSLSDFSQKNSIESGKTRKLIQEDSFEWKFDNEEPNTVLFDLETSYKGNNSFTYSVYENPNGGMNDENDTDENDTDDHNSQDTRNLATVSVYNSSISIDNMNAIPLPCRTLASTKIQSKKPNGRDTLVLFLRNFEIVLIVYELNNDTETVVPYVVDSAYIPGLEILHSNENVYRLDYTTAHDLLFLTTNTGHCLVYNIVYNESGVPSLEHSYNFETSELLFHCFIPISSSRDAFISLELEDDVLILRCISDLLRFRKSKIYFKNKFELPLHMVPLKNSSSILLLQESGYTVKSLSFCIEGEEREPTRENYPMASDALVNSFYIPSKKVDFFNYLSDFDSNFYQHDQIIVSSTDFWVYVIDVFYHPRNNQFETRMRKLFTYKANLTYFSFDSTDVLNEFLLEFYNEMGLCEKKSVVIDCDGEIPILKTIEEYWSEVCYHPILDFELITELDKYSIESHSKELWVLSGTGSNHSLMTFQHGFIAGATDLLFDVYDVDKIYCYDTDKFWLCGDKRAILVQLGVYLDLIAPIFEFQLEYPIIHCIKTSSYTKFVTSRNIVVASLYGIEKCYSFSYDCVLAAGIDDLSVLLVKDDKRKYYIYCELDFNIQNISEYFVTNVADLSTITLLQFVTHEDNTYLVVGTTNSKIFFYFYEDLRFIRHGFVIISPPLSSKHISEYNFIPYQVHIDSDSNILITTSLTGEYAVYKLIIDSDYIAGYEFLAAEKLADLSPLEIIRRKNSIYLKGLHMWKLDLNDCFFPRIVLMDDYNKKPILSAVPLKVTNDIDTFLLLRGNNVSIIEISLEQSMLSRRKNFGVPCMKMKFISELRVFALIKFPGINSNLPQLLFADPKTLKVIKSETDLETFFNDMIPISLHEWNIYDGEKKLVLLAICCSFADELKGAIKIAKISRVGHDINLKHLHMLSSNDPISHISVFYDQENDVNHLLYSSGRKIESYVYLTDDKRSVSRTIYEGSEKIRKFYLTKDLYLHIVNQNQTCFTVKISDLTTFKITQKFTSNELRTDVLPLDKNNILYSNVKEETILITRDSISTSVEVGYLPRFAKVDSFPPWVSLRERSGKNYLQFVTVGLGGEIDLFTLAKKNDKINAKEHEPKRLCQLKEYTTVKLGSIPNVCGNYDFSTKKIAYSSIL